MPRSRDRHGRGLRGPLALPNPWVRHPEGLVAATQPATFQTAVESAVALVMSHAPDALRNIRVAVADVPIVSTRHSGVPLAESVAASDEAPAHVVLYRRPLEHRADSVASLRRLVACRLVEQLSSLTGRSVSELAGDDFELDY